MAREPEPSISMLSETFDLYMKKGKEAKEKGTLIDATHGRRTRAVIITDSDLIILTYLQSETVAARLEETETDDLEDDEDE